MRLRLIRAVSFRAHHRLARPGASAEANRAEFGWTAEPHAHQYRCEVTVSRPAEGALGQVIDLGALDRLLAEEVTGPFAGRRLDEVAAFRGRLATTETLAEEIFRRLSSRLPAGCRLDRVAVAEDAGLTGECVAD